MQAYYTFTDKNDIGIFQVIHADCRMVVLEFVHIWAIVTGFVQS